MLHPTGRLTLGTQLPEMWHFKAQHLHLVAISSTATEGTVLHFHNSRHWDLASGTCLCK